MMITAFVQTYWLDMLIVLGALIAAPTIFAIILAEWGGG
jgi:hypothetical protein